MNGDKRNIDINTNINTDNSVTVLMTTFNEEKSIFSEAIESILKQTFSKFKVLIIVDNKENKEIIEIIKKYQVDDNRISYIINNQNLGLAESLNKGIDIIDTKYIARMDADDIAFENRIEEQVKYAKENPQIDLFGCNVRFIDYEGNVLFDRNKHPFNCKEVKTAQKYINIFHHPTFFGKTDIFKKYKYRNIKYSQDYDFTCRLLEDNCKLSNTEDCLLYYRLPKNTNQEKRYIQRITHYCIQKLYKKKKLINTDIKKYIQDCLDRNKKNKEKTIKGFLLNDKAARQYKQRKFLKVFCSYLISMFLTKYQIIEIWNLVAYKIVELKFK